MTDQRRTSRKKTYLTAYVHSDAKGPSQPCLVRDLSQTGARIMVAGTVRLPEVFDLHINGRPQVLRVQAMWRTATETGVRLLAKIPIDALEVDQAARVAPRIHVDARRMARCRALWPRPDNDSVTSKSAAFRDRVRSKLFKSKRHEESVPRPCSSILEFASSLISDRSESQT